MLSLIAAVVVAGQAPAPANAAAKPVDPARMAAAKALVEQLGVRKQVEAGMAANIAQMRTGVGMRSMLAQQPGFIPAYRANKAKFDPALQKAGGIQADLAQKIVTANIGTVVDEAARAYARNFTLAELQGLSAFYRTPLGQSLYRRQPQLSEEIGQATGRIIGGKLDAAMKANAAKFEAALAPLSTPAPAAAKKK